MKSNKKKKEFNLQYFLFSLLRRNFKRYPFYNICLNKGKVVKMVPSTKSKKKLRRVFFKCSHCKKEFNRKQIFVDHIEPVVNPKRGFETYDIYIDRLFCPLSNLQVLCKTCHNIKSKEENKIRRGSKK